MRVPVAPGTSANSCFVSNLSYKSSNRDISDGNSNGLQAGLQGFVSRQGERILCISVSPGHSVWRKTAIGWWLLFFWGQSGRGVKLTTPFHSLLDKLSDY
jgi:hypothetical protein